ncbi:MAG: hemerythrin domain-containing protein [Alphaproteobacteria bacterium]|nr:hemerythrin domain-containing protein [Alphaproteobacteria bacterium]
MTNNKNILEILQNEHTQVLDLFSQIEKEKTLEKKQEIFKKIKTELDKHNHAEERTFYKKIKEESGQKLLITVGQEEHELAERFMDELENESDEVKWLAKIQILKTLVEDHVSDEEEDIFEVAKQIYNVKELEMIGEEFLAEKKNIMESKGFVGALQNMFKRKT